MECIKHHCKTHIFIFWLLQTPNAQVTYELGDFIESNKQSRFFGVTEEGQIYKKIDTDSDAGVQVFQVNCCIFIR